MDWLEQESDISQGSEGEKKETELLLTFLRHDLGVLRQTF